MSLLLHMHDDFVLPNCPRTGDQTKEMHFWEQLGLTKDNVEAYAMSWKPVHHPEGFWLERMSAGKGRAVTSVDRSTEAQ